jgi:RecA/RadA recombinase
VARGNENLAQTVTLRISRTKPPRFHQQLVSGHRGCGKSTELRQLQAKLQDSGFFVVYLDAEETLDLGEIKKTTARLLHCVWFRNTRTANAGPNCIRRFARSRAFRSASDRSMKS